MQGSVTTLKNKSLTENNGRWSAKASKIDLHFAPLIELKNSRRSLPLSANAVVVFISNWLAHLPLPKEANDAPPQRTAVRKRMDPAANGDALRRAAILVRVLPPETSQRLLQSLDNRMRASIEQAASELTDVDPLERKRALESFSGMVQQHLQRPAAQGIPSGPNPSNAPEPFAASPTSPLAALGQLHNEDLARMLAQEHPQTAAVVMASITPQRAAKLLPLFPAPMRHNVLQRISKLDTLPEGMVAEIASAFEDRIKRLQSANIPNHEITSVGTTGSPAPTSTGDRVVSQILALLGDPNEAPTTDPTSHVPAEAAAVSPSLRAIMSEMPVNNAPATPLAAPGMQTHRGTSPSLANHESLTDANQERERLMQVAQVKTGNKDLAASNAAPVTSGASQRSVSRVENSSDASADTTSWSTDRIHRYLTTCPAMELCRALAMVPTRTAMLALCGLPTKTVDAAIACLPRSQGNAVRTQLAGLGSIQLREIDEAKQTIATAIAGATKISQPAVKQNTKKQAA